MIQTPVRVIVFPSHTLTHTHTHPRKHTHNLHLYGAEDGPEEAQHAQELHPAEVLHRVLLAHVGDGVQRGAHQHQAVAQQDVTGW